MQHEDILIFMIMSLSRYYVTLQKKHHHMSNFKKSSSSKRSAVEHTKTHNDNEIATDSSDSDSVREVFNEDRRVTLEVITHLRIQKNK